MIIGVLGTHWQYYLPPKHNDHHNQSMYVGSDTRPGDDDRDYQVPFRFTGKINKITFKPGPLEMTAGQMKKAAKMNANGRD